jgi:hypothetical protein
MTTLGSRPFDAEDYLCLVPPKLAPSLRQIAFTEPMLQKIITAMYQGNINIRAASVDFGPEWMTFSVPSYRQMLKQDFGICNVYDLEARWQTLRAAAEEEEAAWCIVL